MDENDLMERVRQSRELFREMEGQVPATPCQLVSLLHKITARSVESLYSVEVLCREECFQDAMTIARSVFEAAITVKFLRQNPDRVKEYAEYGIAFVGKQLERIMSDGSVSVPGNISQEQFNEAKERFKSQSKWHRESIRDLAKSVGLEQEYAILYPQLSATAHVTMYDVCVETAEEREALGGLAIGIALRFLNESMLEFNEALSLGYEARINALALHRHSGPIEPA